MLTTNKGKKIVDSMPLILIIAFLFIVSLIFAGKMITLRESGYALQNGENADIITADEKKDEEAKYSDLIMHHAVEVPILLYHHIAEEVTADTVVSPETFESHVKMLVENGYTGVCFEQIVAYVEDEGELPPKPIIITFDDGYLSNYEFAFPVLQKYNMKATIFVIGISVGKDTYRDTGDSDFAILPRFSYEQANEMIESGLVSIQSHSYDMHRWEPFEQLLNGEYRDGILPLENESSDEYRKNFEADSRRAKTELETHTQTKLTAYSYPYGKYTEDADNILREMGIKATVTLYSGSNDIIRHMPETLYRLMRIHVNDIPSETLLENIVKRKINLS